jgi:hypothetical protein
MTQELLEIAEFIKKPILSDSIMNLQEGLDKSIGYSQRIGELLNDAEQNYTNKKAQELVRLNQVVGETETTRKTKLESWVSEEKHLWQSLKNIKSNLRSKQMSIMQAIKTRREEPIKVGNNF